MFLFWKEHLKPLNVTVQPNAIHNYLTEIKLSENLGKYNTLEMAKSKENLMVPACFAIA